MQQVDVDYLMDLELPFIESPNRRRNGWSGVSTIECDGRRYFVKRQRNHTYRDARRFYRRTPTLLREYRNMLRLRKIGLYTPDVVLYAVRGMSSILVTAALDEHLDLPTWLARTSDKDLRLRFFETLIPQLLRIHGARLHHGCLYGRHIMVKADEPESIAFVDLESMRRTLRISHSASKDIGQLFRHTGEINETEKQMIIDAYKRRYSNFESLLVAQTSKRERSDNASSS